MSKTPRSLDRPLVLGTLLLLLGLSGGFHLGRASDPGPDEPHPHEYAPISTLSGPDAARARTVAMGQFGGPTLDGGSVDFEELLGDHEVVMATWFAEWCANCGYEAPHLGRLARQWADRGLAVVARSEYSHPDEVRRFMGRHAFHVPVVLGSANPDPDREDEVRLGTEHYRLRTSLGDTRKWGTPLTLIFTRGSDPVGVVLGEYVPDEIEAYLWERLGAPRMSAPLEPVRPTRSP